jgi:YidC/Oxa1 family membrane protein insertase
MDSKGYGGDKRRVRFGYLLSPRSDPAQESVLASDFLISRMDALGKRADRSGPYLAEKPQWPNSTSQEEGLTLVWFGMTNRYFGVAVHPLIPADGSIAPGAQGRAFRTIEKVDRIVLDQGFDADGNSLETVALRTMSPMLELAPGSAADLSQAVFAGPLSKPTIRADKVKDALNLEGLVVYNFGGPCGPCTFTFLTSLLIWLLRSLHDYVLFDWALAVAVLVVIVRGVLHPVTRWSQKRMTRFGKRMQEVAPKQKKLQEKYKGDSKKLQEETAKLWREEGVSPLGFLGCIPMFLQMPIWIALYATLYFASEMRHEPALFGIFQSITGGSWKFLADLAEPDAFISFGRDFHVPLLSGILGPIGSLNVLPIVLGFVYYAHQKYFTPPSTVQLTPEQETTQKITKWMMVVMFPLFMYNAPSGLAIYFIVNSTLGIFESRWIRHLVDTEDKHLAELAKQGKKPPRKESFWERAMRLAEEQKKAKESMNRGRGGKR